MRYCVPSEIHIIQHNGMAPIKKYMKLVSLTAFRDCIFRWILFRGWNLLNNERALGKEGVFGLSQCSGMLLAVLCECCTAKCAFNDYVKIVVPCYTL
jgi:hypothetical protein